MINRICQSVILFFNRPLKVLALCAVFAFLVLVVDGSLLQLWGLHRKQGRIDQKIDKYRTDIKKLQSELNLARQPEFVAKKARDRFDLVNKDEIVFVFPDR